MTRAAIALAIALAACSKRAPIDACSDDLTGPWTTEAGERWMVLDHGPTLEIYALFDDTHPANAPAGLELGPRVIDLARAAPGTDGDVKRRYLRAGDECIGTAPAHLLRCHDDTLELVRADPAPPAAFAPCQWGRPEPSRREKWQRLVR